MQWLLLMSVLGLSNKVWILLHVTFVACWTFTLRVVAMQFCLMISMMSVSNISWNFSFDTRMWINTTRALPVCVCAHGTSACIPWTLYSRVTTHALFYLQLGYTSSWLLINVQINWLAPRKLQPQIYELCLLFGIAKLFPGKVIISYLCFNQRPANFEK